MADETENTTTETTTQPPADDVIRATPGKKRDKTDPRDPATVEDRNNNLVVVNDPDDEALLEPGETPARAKFGNEVEETEETAPSS